MSFVFSKTALFIPDLEKSGWIYLELRRIKEVFAWGCSLCENLETFREIKDNKELKAAYCIHAQVAEVLVSKDDMANKFSEKKEKN